MCLKLVYQQPFCIELGCCKRVKIEYVIETVSPVQKKREKEYRGLINAKPLVQTQTARRVDSESLCYALIALQSSRTSIIIPVVEKINTERDG